MGPLHRAATCPNLINERVGQLEKMGLFWGGFQDPGRLLVTYRISVSA